MRGGDISHFGYRLSDLECPDIVGTTGLGCCIPPCFLVMFATGWERTSESESELLLVTRSNDNHSPGPVMREVSP